MTTNNAIESSSNIYLSVPGGYVTDTGSVNVYAATITQNPSLSLSPGLIILLKISHTNTSSSTFNINGLGAIAIVKSSTSGLIALVGGELIQNSTYELLYNGTNFQVLSPDLPSSVGSNGYQYFPNGLIFQWGSLTIPTSVTEASSSAVSFTKTFPNNVFSITTTFQQQPNVNTGALTTGAFPISTSGFTFHIDTAQPGQAITNTIPVSWMAIGN